MSAPATRRLCVFAAERASRPRRTISVTSLRRRQPQWQQFPAPGLQRPYATKKSTSDTTTTTTPKRRGRPPKVPKDDPEAPAQAVAEGSPQERVESVPEAAAEVVPQERVENVAQSAAEEQPQSLNASPADASNDVESLESPAGADVLHTPGVLEPDLIPAEAVLVSEEEESVEQPSDHLDLESPQPISTSDTTTQEATATGSPQGKQKKKVKERLDSFWSYATPAAGDQKYLEDNVTPLGHDELEQQREYREYARLAAWELPLLSKLVKQYEPPSRAQPLRFRYTSYLGEEHPAASKVVLEFSPFDLPDLNEGQQDKLIKLLGVRYNPATRLAKMSHEAYDAQAQNKRYLLDRLQELLHEAKHGEDTFADVPFDFRHHKSKKWHEFPKEWIATPERLQQLRLKRANEEGKGTREVADETLVDGNDIVQRALQEPDFEAQRVIVNRTTGRSIRPAQRL